MSRELDHGPDSERRRRRSVVAAALVAVLVLGLVAFLAAGASDDDRQVSAPQVDVPAVWFDILLGALGAMTLVVWIGLIISAVSERSGEHTLKPSRTVPGMLLAGALMWFVFTVWTPSNEPVVIEAPPPGLDVPTDQDTDTVPGDSAAPAAGSTWWLIVGAGLVLGAVGLLAWAARGRSQPPTDHADTALQRRRDLLIGLLDDALVDLRTHPDPRAAVIAAWARLEDALTMADVTRLPGDTPSRYLAKVLAAVEVSAERVQRFTDAFERAMFSPQQITVADQQAAVDALVEVRDELHLLSYRPEPLESPA